jgi:hypothetical protein
MNEMDEKEMTGNSKRIRSPEIVDWLLAIDFDLRKVPLETRMNDLLFIKLEE